MPKASVKGKCRVKARSSIAQLGDDPALGRYGRHSRGTGRVYVDPSEAHASGTWSDTQPNASQHTTGLSSLRHLTVQKWTVALNFDIQVIF